MELSTNNKLDIMEINLDCLKNKELESDCILISEEEYKWMRGRLLKLERYEDCRVMADKKDLFVGDVTTTFI